MEHSYLQEVSAERFVITDDGQADRAARKVLARRQERDRLVAHYKRQIELANTACAADESYYTVPLMEYLATTPGKRETKTLIKCELASAELVLTKGKADYGHTDEQALTAWLEANGYGDYVKVEKKPMWGEFKKLLVINGGAAVVKDTGEVVDCLTIVEKSEKFDVKEAGRGA